jgi:glycine hydroxymethyltransferase
MTEDFVSYQHQVVKNAIRLGESLIRENLRLVSGGTDTHLLLIDLTAINITGKEAEEYLQEIGIIANKNKIPYDNKPAAITSGLRLGTPSITTRGMKEEEMDELGSIIGSAIKGLSSKSSLKERVSTLASRFFI